jgi:nitrogen fixation NifU-like protein
MSPARVEPVPSALYSGAIRERWRRPRFRGEAPGATAVAEDVNPLCGDRVRLSLAVQDGVVTAARFTGDSCAICTASADVVAELAQGRSPAAAAALGPPDVLGVLRAEIRPARLRCLTLPLDVLRAALGGAR